MFLINALLDRGRLFEGAFKRGGRLLNFCEFKGGVYSRGAFKRRGAFNRSITVFINVNLQMAIMLEGGKIKM